MVEVFDVVIIGAGPGGYVAAELAGNAGLKTLIIEKGTYGGVCLNTGCIPTKTLLKSSKVADYIKNANNYGIDGVDPTKITYNWANMQARKNKVVMQLSMGVKTIIKMAKATTIAGEAKIVNDHSLTVNDRTIEFKYLIIATGSHARLLNLDGFETGYKNGDVVDNVGALSFPKIPQTLTVIGGGVIGIEFAILYAELGTKVTILQGLDTILELLDKDVSLYMAKLLKDKGVEIITNVKVLSYQNHLVSYNLDNQTKVLQADKVLVSIGRIPSKLGLDKLNLALIPNQGIKTNEYMQTNIRHIYAIGDVTGGIMLAHVASKQAQVTIDHIVNHQSKNKYDHQIVPSCIYTFPEVAVIGQTEAQLVIAKTPFVKTKFLMTHLGKAIADGETEGFIKFLLDPKKGTILGAHIIASTASDMISELALVMDLKATVFDINNSIHPHPTISEIIHEAAMAAIHEHFSK